MLPACNVIDGDLLLLLSQKSQDEFKVEKWASVS